MRLKKVFEKDSYEYYKYTPSLLKPFYINLEQLTLRRKARLALAFFAGYSVYYLVHNQEYIGYCLVQSGKDGRYRFATDRDIIVGPYFIKEKHRGKRLSIYLLDYILNHAGLSFIHAYDYIHKDNVPSIKASESVGFNYMSDGKYNQIFKEY